MFRCASFLAAVRPSAFLRDLLLTSQTTTTRPLQHLSSLPEVSRPGICNNCKPIAFGSDHRHRDNGRGGPWPKKCSRAWWPFPSDVSEIKPRRTRTPQSHQKHSNAGAYRDSRARCTTSLRETFRLFSPWLEVGGGFLILIENEKGGGAVWKGKTAYFGRKRELSVAHLLVDLREVYSRSTTCTRIPKSRIHC